MNENDSNLFSSIEGLQSEDIVETIITQIIRLESPATNRFDRSKHIILKEFINCTIKPEFRDVQLQKINSVYFHMPYKGYNVEMPDLQLKSSLNLSTNWFSTYKNDLSEVVFETYRLTSSPGCPHKSSGCSIFCDSCKKSFPCRYCHDDAQDHIISINQITKIECKRCKKLQDFSCKCQFCNFQFGVSNCEICKISQFNDVNRAPLTHCDACQKCYGCLKDQIQHCEKCNFCIDSESFKRHICADICLVCYENFSQGSLSVQVQPCGHIIHSLCFTQLRSKQMNKCVICRRINFLDYEKNIYDEFLKIKFIKEGFQMVEPISLSCYKCKSCFNQQQCDFNFCKNCQDFDCQSIDFDSKYQDWSYSTADLVNFFINVYFYKNYNSIEMFCEQNSLVLTQQLLLFLIAFIMSIKQNQSKKMDFQSFLLLLRQN